MNWIKVVACIVAMTLPPRPASAEASLQDPQIVIRVIDAKGQPVRGAFLEPALGSGRRTSDSDGRIYLPSAFEGLVVRVRKLGFSPVDLTIAKGEVPIFVQLRETASLLENVSVVSTRTAPLSRVVTASSVKQVPALSEPDIFRAAVLLPAVSQPNDLRGRLHLAGGSSDETAVTLNGHPLQDPFHVLGLLGAFNLGALDEAVVRIHHVPATSRSGISGTIDLQSKAVAERTAGEAIIGLLSGAVTVTRPNIYRGLDLMLSARSTYLDKLIERFANHSSFGGDNLTLLGYRDAMLTVRTPLSIQSVLKLTAFGTRDSKSFQDTAGLRTRSYDWGEGVVGFAFERNAGVWSQYVRGSFNRAFADLPSAGSTEGSLGEIVDLRHDLASMSLGVAKVTKRQKLDFGISLDHRNTNQRWHGTPSDFFTENAPRNFLGSEHQTIVEVQANQLIRISRKTSLETGVRMPVNEMRAYFGPRIALSADLNDAMTIASSFDVRHQFVAELEEPREGSGKQPLFLLDRPRYAAISALSLTRWLRSANGEKSNSAEAVVFYKQYRDKPYFQSDQPEEDDESPAPSSPKFTRVSATSVGATLSVNRRFGSTAVQGSYTYQRVKDRINSETIPTAWDTPHSVSVFATSRLGRNWFASSTVLAHSGQTVTPVEARLLAPTDPTDIFLSNRYLFGASNSARLSPYVRVDVGFQRRWGGPRNTRSLSLQVLNVFGRKNALEWDWTTYFCVKAGVCKQPDVIRRGLPVIPTLSFEAHW